MLYLILGFGLLSNLPAQNISIGLWKSYTDMKSVSGAVQAGSSIWAATGGGVFVFDTTTGEFTKFTNTEMLSSNDLQCIINEHDKRIWVGGKNGLISVRDLSTKNWLTIDANRSTDKSKIGVQSFFLKGDTMFIATVFGVVPFKISKWKFGDTYASFGFVLTPLVKCVLVHSDRIWVGTDQGIATALLTMSNLSDPDSWITYDSILTTPGYLSKSVSSLVVLNDTIIAATDQGLGYFDGTMFRAIGSSLGKNICDLRIVNGKLLMLWNANSGFTIESLVSLGDVPQVIDSNFTVQGTNIIQTSSLWISTLTKGITRRSGYEWIYKYPNGPNSNSFSSLAVDANGVLWATSGGNSNAGFYRYDASLPDNSKWKNYTGDEYPLIRKSGYPYNYYYKVSLCINGSVWMSSWGDGVVEVIADTIRRKFNYYSVPSLPGARSDPQHFDYVVTGGVAIDDDGRTWIANRNETGGRSLICLNPDSTYTYFDNPTTGRFHDLVIDRYGTKWLATSVPSAEIDLGLYFFNENNIISGTQYFDGGWWGSLLTADGLQSNTVFTFTIDLEGNLWIGTSLGVAIISDPRYPGQRTTSFPLREQSIQTIAVDAVNNKWIGTKEGAFVMNVDGTQQLRNYDVITTKGQLLSNDIRAIAIDQKRGIVYFGTEKGLSSLSIEAVQTSRSYTELEFGPNPFILPSNQPLTIRNLVANSTIKIINVSSSVVIQFMAQGGGRAFWDGRDRNGEYVSSGIYFVVASSENGAQVITGKIAVIHK